MIPTDVKIKNNALPDCPGVYFFYDKKGTLLYVGKATSIKKRVGSYFVKAHPSTRTTELVEKIARIDFTTTPTVIEALVLEANQIRAQQPPYNVMQRDDKSFLYLCITREDFPKPVLLRGHDLERMGVLPFSSTLSGVAKRKFLAVFGPYVSGRSLRTALDIIRKTIPWSTCSFGGVTRAGPTTAHSERQRNEHRRGAKRQDPDKNSRLCFDAQIGKCPGVCTGAISKKEYRNIIRHLILFFSGKKEQLLRQLRRDMLRAAKAKDFERAAQLRNRVFALEHIQDTALIFRDSENYPAIPLCPYPAPHRIEAYDIAHISGTSTAAAMVVFEDGEPLKSAYRKFRIKSFEGSNDVAALQEMMRRRIARSVSSPTTWGLPDIMVIDGGELQISAVQKVLDDMHAVVPIIGIAKGFDRKQDRLVYDTSNAALTDIATHHKQLLQSARDEAHRFAGVYHRVLRSRRSLFPASQRRGKGRS